MTTIINGSSPSITFSDGSAQTSATRPFLNRIINGAMLIDQRNAGASVTITNTAPYTLDRFYGISEPASKFTVQQNAGSVTPPAGFTNYAGITSTSAYSIASTDYMLFRQAIEGFNVADLGWGTANAKTVTLSFWVRSSLTGTFGGSLSNSASNRSYPYSYTISAANTWEYKTVTIAGDTTGTWLTNNGIGIVVSWSLGMGSTYSGPAGAWAAGFLGAPTGAVSVVGVSGATFFLTGCQLEIGSTATSFDYRPYGTELALCQRYYQTITDVKTGQYYTGSANPVRSGSVYYPVIMRTAATVTFVSPTFGNATYIGTDGNYTWGFNTYVGTSGGGAYYWQSNITASAEL